MRKKIAATAMGAALLAGGGLGTALLAPTTATAASSSSSSSSSSTKTDAQRGAWMTAALKKLVNAGTITQAQADAVAKALESARPEGGPGHHGGPGLTVAAKAIGISEAELRTAVQSGQTIADVARAKSVDVTTVIDAIVSEMNSHLADAVSNGKLTQAQADEMKSKASRARHRSRQRHTSAPRRPRSRWSAAERHVIVERVHQLIPAAEPARRAHPRRCASD